MLHCKTSNYREWVKELKKGEKITRKFYIRFGNEKANKKFSFKYIWTKNN